MPGDITVLDFEAIIKGFHNVSGFNHLGPVYLGRPYTPENITPSFG